MQLIKSLPYDEISNIAKETKVDYKAKKIKGLNMMIDTIYAMLSSSQVSQRILSLENGVPLPPEIKLRYELKFDPVSHSSFSERLDKVNISFFERSYQHICNVYRDLVPDDYLDEMSITRVDSTMVAETANKLRKGFSTGVNDRFGGDRRQLKYTMAYNGLGVSAARIFTDKAYSSDNAPISKVVHESLRKSGGISDWYTFDRGLENVNDFGTISDHTRKEDACFVGRLKLARSTSVETDRLREDKVREDGELELVGDTLGYLRARNSTKWDTGHEYRFIRVRFKNPRPRNSSGASKRKRRYDEEMVLITNDFTSEAMTIARTYRKRWDIEVFFKFLKQDLSFSHFISTTVNGLRVMMYMTLIVALLIKIYSLTHNMGLRLSKIAIATEIIKYHQTQIKDLENVNKQLVQEIETLKSRLECQQVSSDH